jgi:hypothetical protein
MKPMAHDAAALLFVAIVGPAPVTRALGRMRRIPREWSINGHRRANSAMAMMALST